MMPAMASRSVAWWASPQVSGAEGSERPVPRSSTSSSRCRSPSASRQEPNIVWSSPGPPCRTNSARSPAPRSVTCRRVSPTSMSIGAPYPRYEMSEQHTQGISGGWLPPTAPDAPAQRPAPFGEPRSPWWRRAGSGLLATLILIGAKLKTLLLLLPKLKVLTTSGSMLVSVGAYALIWGWRFAVGFVVLLFIHEMGHVIALRREGVEASAPVFIPFLGAVVWAKSLGGNALAEARVGLAGPILRTIGAGACLYPRHYSEGRLPAHHRGDGRRPVASAGLHRLLFEPLHPAAGDAARRRPRDGRAGPVDVVRRPRRDRRPRARLPQSDHPHHRRRGRLRRLRALVAPAPGRRRGAHVLRGARARPRAGRAGLPRAHRRARGGHGRDPPAALDPLLAKRAPGARGWRARRATRGSGGGRRSPRTCGRP